MLQRTRLMGAWPLALGAALGALLLWAATARSEPQPAPGMLLVASEGMADPRFNRSVVLLIEHDDTGSWGLIINKPTEIGVDEVVPSIEWPETASNVYFGGPVRVDHLTLLYRDEAGDEAGDEPDTARTGLPGVHWSESADELRRRLARNPARARVYAGYAGWAPGQLAFELTRGGWRLIEGRPANVFSDEPERLWQRLHDALEGIAI